MIETETPMDEIAMIETQTSVVSDVSDTKQLHTHTAPKLIVKDIHTYTTHNSTICFPYHRPLVPRVA